MEKLRNSSPFLVLALSLCLRLVVIDQSLWLDEAIGAIAARDFSYSKILREFMLSDNHPPLYYLFLKTWASLFGFSEVSLRMPSVLFGVGTIYLVYKISKSLKIENWKLVIIMLATSPLHIYYSQEARMYSMAAFFATSAIYFLVRQKWVFFSSSILVLAFTDYMPWFMFPVFPIYGFVKHKSKAWFVSLLISFVPLFIGFLLWFPIFIIQSWKGRWLLTTLPAWRDLAGGANLKQLVLVWTKFVLGRLSFLNKLTYYLVVSLVSIPFVIALLNAWIVRKKVLLTWLWLLVPLVLGFLFSVSTPAFTYFRYIYILPAFYVLLAANSKKRIMFLILFINIVGLSIYYLNPRQQREDWRGAVNFVETRIQEDEIVLFHNPEPFAPYRWYAQKPDAFGATNSISASREETLNKTKDLISGRDAVYLFEYLKTLEDPENFVGSALNKEGLEKVAKFDFRGVGFVEYWRRI
ncbi:hypothetical protein A2691_04740 [Candidatus Woesebacteria bacterium RIFCSPHIGHO2_01_FULL_39_23]|nr:MAG: hypothetical protein A2691_04740 [Candidatus Woesebacteria bacterium RIFCSPHIGHO2_01_FULL_39_23]